MNKHNGNAGIGTVTLAAVLGTVTLWASGFPAIQVGLEGYGPGELALLRFSVASLCFAAYAIPARMPLPRREHWGGLFFLGSLGITFHHVSLNYGQQTVPAGTASIFIATVPVVMALLAWWLLDEQLTSWGWLGIAISFTGVVVITVGGGRSFAFTVSSLVILLSVIATSFFFVLQQPFFQHYRPLQVAVYATWAGTLPMVVFLPGLLQTASRAPPAATLSGVYIGVFASAVAYALWNVALSRSHTGRISSFLNLSPVIAIVITWAWLGDAPTVTSLVGGAVTLGGVMVVNRWGRGQPAGPEPGGDKTSGQKHGTR